MILLRAGVDLPAFVNCVSAINELEIQFGDVFSGHRDLIKPEKLFGLPTTEYNIEHI